MTSTADQVLARLQNVTQERGGQYRANSPYRTDSDSGKSFVLRVEDGEHGTWFDFVNREGGSLYDLANHMGIELPEREPVEETKRPYKDLDDYALAQGAYGDVFRACGWQDVMYGSRPAIEFPTASGTRWRFLDATSGNGKNKYTSEKGYKPCWYGLKRAIVMAQKTGQPLVLCNGEASTVVAQHYGIPAFCKTSGEGNIPDDMIQQLKALWRGKILIAYDNDKTGWNAARSAYNQIGKNQSLIIDLGMGKGGDLAQFCKLHLSQSPAEIQKRAQAANVPIQPSTTTVKEIIGQIEMDLSGDGEDGKPFLFPFKSFHRFEGMCEVLLPGKCVFIAGSSGSGKTAFTETFVDKLTAANIDGLWWGTEWNPKEMMQRRIQRYSQLQDGLPMTRWAKLQIWHYEEKAGIPVNERSGRPFSTDELQDIRCTLTNVQSWPGQGEYLPLFYDVDEILVSAATAVEAKRKAGRHISYIVFDYINLMHCNDVVINGNIYEHIAGKLKAFGETHRLTPVILVQFTKEGARGNANGYTAPSGEDLQFLRRDKANLILILGREYDEDPEFEGAQLPTPRGWVRIDKNSLGAEKRNVPMVFRGERLLWVDRNWKKGGVGAG